VTLTSTNSSVTGDDNQNRPPSLCRAPHLWALRTGQPFRALEQRLYLAEYLDDAPAVAVMVVRLLHHGEVVDVPGDGLPPEESLREKRLASERTGTRSVRPAIAVHSSTALTLTIIRATRSVTRILYAYAPFMPEISPRCSSYDAQSKRSRRRVKAFTPRLHIWRNDVGRTVTASIEIQRSIERRAD
jgi:hypothetical protein